MVHLGYETITVCQAEFRRERKPDFAEEESVGLLKALRRGKQSAVWRIELGMLQIQTGEQSVAESVALLLSAEGDAISKAPCGR